MKKILLVAMMMIFCMAGMANAAPMTWEDCLDWDSSLRLYNDNPSESYVHDIRDDGFDPWLDGNSTYDVATNFELTVFLHNDGDTNREAVIVSDILGDEISAQNSEISWTDELTGWSIIGLIEINLFGTLDVTVTRVTGDFWLDASNLVVNGYSNSASVGNSNSAPVPEPSTILLMGAGILGLVGYNRKRSSKEA